MQYNINDNHWNRERGGGEGEVQREGEKLRCIMQIRPLRLEF